MIQKMKSSFVNLSLKRKWFSMTAATIFITYTLVCVIIYVALYGWLLENEKTNAFRTVDDLTGYMNSQRSGFTIQELQNQIGLMTAILNQEQTVRLFDLDGNEVIQINNTSSAVSLYDVDIKRGVATVETMKVDEIESFVIHQIVQIGPYEMILQLIHPLTTFDSMMGYVLTTMLIMGIGAIEIGRAHV